MSTDASSAPSPAAAQEWPPLNLHDRRVLGVLVEKAKTTPDAYPLSLNALVTGCNQKSNRDPVLNLSDLEIEDALTRLQKKVLVVRIQGAGRVERWKHNLYDAWSVGKVELAVLAELLLRGPQTEGELRQRASRMEEIADLDTLRDILNKLAERKMIVYLTPPGQRGTKLTHGFHSPKELETLRHSSSLAAPPSVEGPEPEHAAVTASRPLPPATSFSPAVSDERLSQLEDTLAQQKSELQELRTQFAQLQATVANLTQDLKNLRDALGA
jgi:uncharacterized protein YceH (UPF0502 family)